MMMPTAAGAVSCSVRSTAAISWARASRSARSSNVSSALGHPLSRSRSRHWPTALVYIPFRSFIVGWTYSERAPFLCEHHALSTSVGQLESFGGGLGGSRPASIRGSWSRMKPLLRIRKSAR